MRVLSIRPFTRFQRKERISDKSLLDAVARAESGRFDADLGGGLIKQRIARPGQGKSGGYRTVIAYRRGNRAIFLYGFAKNERNNIDEDELKSWQSIGAGWLAADDAAIAKAVKEDRARRIEHDDKKKHEDQQ